MLEVLIAVVAFAIVLAAINAVFYGALRLRNKTTTALEEALTLQQSISIIKRDLANIVTPGGMLSGGLQSGSTSNKMAGQSSPAFYTSTGIIDETSPWAEVQRVSYLLVDSTNRAAGQDLVRSVTRNLLPTLGEDQPIQQWLMGGVQGMAFLFHDGTQWLESWDSTAPDLATGLSNSLPQAIKVKITLSSDATGRTPLAPIELVVPLLVQARTNQTAQTTGGQQ